MQSVIKEHVFKFYLAPALVTDIDFVKTVLPKYVADMNFVLQKNTDRRLLFDPETDIILTGTQPHSNQATPPLPVEGFEIWAYAVSTNSPTSYGGYAGIDTSGAGVVAGLKWTRLYDPDHLTAGNASDYWTQINNMLHELAHVFGAGYGEYYKLSIVQDTTGVSPLLNINVYDQNDSFWSDKPDFKTDPLLWNPVQVGVLGQSPNRETLLNFVQYSGLTAAIMSGNYRNLTPTVDLSRLGVKVVSDSGLPIDSANVKIWSVVGSSPYQTQLMVDGFTDSNGELTFTWGGSANPHNTYDFLRLIKVYKDGYLASAKYVSIFDTDISKLVGASDMFSTTISLNKTISPPSTAPLADIDVYISGAFKDTYAISPSGRVTPQYSGVQNGPVRVVSTNDTSFFTSERSLYANSFNEVMGYPASQLTNEYYFPWYDQKDMTTWVLVGNPSASQAAHVEVLIAGISRGTFTVDPIKSIELQFPGVQDGPVKITSDINVFTSERSLYANSFNEVMGYPASQLTNEYYFPWYDQKDMTTWVLVGNPSASQVAHVAVLIAGISRGTFTIDPGKSIVPQFPGVQDGPVKITSDINIFTSERSLYGSSFNEVMGYPASQLTNEYYFPWYDQKDMITWVLVGNPSASQVAHVEVLIAGISRGTFTIDPGKSIVPQFPGVQDGPVKITSDINIFTSERSLYSSSFNEVMGYPANQLTTEYYFPWYDQKNMITWVLIGMP